MLSSPGSPESPGLGTTVLTDPTSPLPIYEGFDYTRVFYTVTTLYISIIYIALLYVSFRFTTVINIVIILFPWWIAAPYTSPAVRSPLPVFRQHLPERVYNVYNIYIYTHYVKRTVFFTLRAGMI